MRLLVLACLAALAPAAAVIPWQFGPARLTLGGAALQLPEDWIYVRGSGLRAFLDATGNTLTGRELAVVGRRDLAWFAVISSAGRARPGSSEEELTEPDGRQVVLLTLSVPTGESSLLVEILAERPNRALARAAAASLQARLAPPPQHVWWPWAAALVAALGLLAFLRYRGL